MKTTIYFFCLPALLLTSLLVGCHRPASDAEVVSEGVICSVTYMQADGSNTGFTRLNSSKAVPGGNGAWNVDAYGRLTHDFLFITRPQRADLGTQVIPVTRLVELQFADGGIAHVDETHPSP